MSGVGGLRHLPRRPAALLNQRGLRTHLLAPRQHANGSTLWTLSSPSTQPPSCYSKPEQHKLWDVLTALRGPDSPENRNSVKSATTEVIRLHAFPNAAAYNALYGDFSADSELRVERRAKMPSVGGHFYGHAKEAFKALGLVWNRLNASIGSKGVEQEPTPLPISSFGNGNNDQFDTY
jgi:hypothetical protein